MEQSISAVLKPSLRRVDISKYAPGSNKAPYEFWLGLSCTEGTRVPPPLPERVAHLLAHEKSFYAKSDVAVVAGLHASFFEAVAPVQQRLDFSKLGWKHAEAVLLVEVLPRFGSLEHLDLSQNDLGSNGGKGGVAIADVLRVNASLKELLLYRNDIGLVGGVPWRSLKPCDSTPH